MTVAPPLHAELPEALQPLLQQDPLEIGDAAQPHLVEVLVGVDESRHDEQPGGVDDRLARLRPEVADLGDAAVGHAHVDVAQLAIVLVEGQEMGDVAQQQSRHGRQSVKLGETAG